MQNFRLPPRAHQNRFLRPVRDGGLLLSEHALAGAGCVHENLIEKAPEPRLQPLRVLIQNQRVRDAEALNIGRENFRALGVYLVADEKATSLHFPRQLRGFSARRGAKIEQPLARLRVKQSCGRHRAGLLQIVKPRLVIRRLSRSRFRVIVIPAGRPRNRRKRKRGQIGKGSPFQGIQPQADRAGPGKARGECVVVLFEQALHASCKCFRKQADLPFRKIADTFLLYCIRWEMKRTDFAARAKRDCSDVLFATASVLFLCYACFSFSISRLC